MIGIRIARRFHQPQSRQAREQDRQGDLQFQPRERRADAKMRPCAKSQLGFGRACGVEPRGGVPHLRVAVGGPQEASDTVTASKAVAYHVDILVNPTREHVQWRIEPQDFLGRCRDPVRAKCCGGGGVFQQRLDAIAQGVNRRLVSGVQ